MTLELHKVASQVKTMGQALTEQSLQRRQIVDEAHSLLHQFATDHSPLFARIERAESVFKKQRFDWVGAAPTGEALTQAFPLPAGPNQVTVIAGDGSQILPDRHAITLYYLINVGSLIYRHGSNEKPIAYNPEPLLCYRPEDILDEQGRLISSSEINVKRDLAEMGVLVELAGRAAPAGEPLVALVDGQLTLRVIDLPFHQQEERQNEYIALLDHLRDAGAALAGYIDRPRSTFILSLLHLAGLELEAITEENLRQNRFRSLTDLDLFDFLGPGQRSAIFTTKAKGLEKYTYAGHSIHFFYLNAGPNPDSPQLARVEIPAWVATDPIALDTLHAAIIRQAALTGGFPYVLARADELAVISPEEREAVEMMLAVEMRRHGLTPSLSSKQSNKNAFRSGRESFRL